MVTDNILEITDLNVGFVTEEGTLKALRHIDLAIPNGAIVGVVGESGCESQPLLIASSGC